MKKFKPYIATAVIIIAAALCILLILGSNSCQDQTTTTTTQISSEEIIETTTTNTTSTTTCTTSTTTTTSEATTNTTTTTIIPTTTDIHDIITEILTTTKPTTTTVTTVQVPEDLPENTNPPLENLKSIGNFKGTYYVVKTPCNGGSGRILVDCGVNLNDSYKGSVASKYIFKNYGYKVNGKTMVYLEIQEYSEMNGWYSVDDCNGNTKIIDFYFSNADNCPFKYAGTCHVKAYMP